MILLVQIAALVTDCGTCTASFIPVCNISEALHCLLYAYRCSV